MSKTSPKQRYTQLMNWLSTKQTGGKDAKKPRKFSKSDHYKKVNKYYGSKEIN